MTEAIPETRDFSAQRDGELHRLSVEDFHELLRLGILDADDRVELLRGLLVKKMSINPPHAMTVQKLNRLLMRKLPEEFVVRCQSPITLSDSEPEPDFAVVLGPDDRYLDVHPVPADVLLVMEVSHSTFPRDSTLKLSIYAAAKLPEYWLIDLVAGEVVVYTQPKGGKKPGFRGRVVYDKASEIPLVLGGKNVGSIRVAEFIS
jgi:Uma2 family endonuclease